MPTRISIPEVGLVDFPDEMTDRQIELESNRLYEQSVSGRGLRTELEQEQKPKSIVSPEGLSEITPGEAAIGVIYPPQGWANILSLVPAMARYEPSRPIVPPEALEIPMRMTAAQILARKLAPEATEAFQKTVAGGVASMTAPETLPYLPAFNIPVVGELMMGKIALDQAAQAAGTGSVAIERRDPALAGEAVGEAALATTLALPAARKVPGQVRVAADVIRDPLGLAGIEEFAPSDISPLGIEPTPIRPPAREPVVVPETAAEPRLTVIEEIRQANARTVADVQKLFPKAELSREQARALRNQAFPETAKVPSAIQPSAEEIVRPVPPQPIEGPRQVPIEEVPGGIRGGGPPEAEAGRPEVPVEPTEETVPEEIKAPEAQPTEDEPPPTEPEGVEPLAPTLTPTAPQEAGAGGVAAPPEESPAPQAIPQAPSSQPVVSPKPGIPDLNEAVNRIADLIRKPEPLLRRDVHDILTKPYGGSIAEGKFTPKDLDDAVEMAMNRIILEMPHSELWQTDPQLAIVRLKEMLSRIPTQTVRTAEMDKLQQFSTPPHLAYVANWVANLTDKDVVLEPSAGVGGLAAFAKNRGAEVVANELSPRRAKLLEQLGIADYLSTENAEHLNALFDPLIKAGVMKRPTAVVMNPPFSNAATTSRSNTLVGAKHVEEALNILPDGGRLVAIVGEGMAMGKAMFRPWWDRIMREYNVRANIGVAGSEYRKYGTSFGNQLVVIDKTGPTPEGGPVVGQVEKVEDLIPLLERIRNERPDISGTQPPAAEPSGPAPVEGGTGGAGAPAAPRPGPRPAGVPRPAGGPPTAPSPSDAALVEPGPEPAGGGAAPSGEVTVSPRGGTGPTAPYSGPGGHDLGGDQLKATAESEGLTPEQFEAGQRKLNEEGVFSEYQPVKVRISGSKKHPTALVEPTAMASVDPVDPKYSPKIPKELVESGALSDAQLENVVYAGQAHTRHMPNGERLGYFIGDGTGVGKGRQIGAIIIDNWNQGRKKHVWVSKKGDLIADAQRDLKDLGFDVTKLLNFWKKPEILSAYKEGVAFVPYSSLRMDNPGLSPEGQLLPPRPGKKGGPPVPARIHRLQQWLGKDFDGVIVFDEAHQAGNAIDIETTRGTKAASETGRVVVQLQRLFPQARVVYASATGATDVTNLSYGDRLGIWGPKTPFETKQKFFDAIKSGGLSAMEIVARDLKSMGRYLARTLSFEGVDRRQLVHEMTPEQTRMYDELSRAWQYVFEERNTTMAHTGASKNGRAMGKANSAFFGAQQRFYNQLLTAIQMPSVLKDAREQLAKKNSVVMQLVNTDEAAQSRAIAAKSGEAEAGENYLEDLDLSPREILTEYIKNSYPTQLYHPVQDPQTGTISWVPVVDKEGNYVQDPKAIAKRQEILDRVQMVQAPTSPLGMVLDAFGVENVAEVTGRGKRVVQKLQEDGSRKTVLEANRTESHRRREADEFLAGKRRVLVFSNAGGTGFSYHAGRKFKNQERRIHYLIQAGWRADEAMQGFGRTHRSDQASAPYYVLASTNLKGHQRFISTIARRLSELGALTGGERKSAGGELFDEMSNLENNYAEDAVLSLFREIHSGELPELNIDTVAQKLGFTRKVLNDRTGELKTINMLKDERTGALVVSKIPDVRQYLNRILQLEVNEQNHMFDLFMERYANRVEAAKADGSYDPGTQTLKALSARVVKDETVYKDPESTATTRLVQIESDHPTQKIPWETLKVGSDVKGYALNNKSGRLYAFKDAANRTLESGEVVETYRRMWAGGYDIVARRDVQRGDYTQLTEPEAKQTWNRQLAELPAVRKENNTYVVGAFLPIWDRLKIPNPKIWRIKTEDGKVFLGARVPKKMTDAVRGRLGAGAGEVKSPEEVFRSVLDDGQRHELANGWVLKRARVQGENRIEIEGVQYDQMQEVEGLGGFMERIDWKPRFFIPVEEAKGIETVKNVLEKAPLAKKQEPGIPPEEGEEGGGGDVGRFGPGAMTSGELESIAAARIEAGKPPGGAQPPSVAVPSDRNIELTIQRQPKDFTIFNKLNSGQWAFGFARLGEFAKKAWQLMALGEFQMRADIGRDVRAIIQHPVEMLPRNLKREGASAFFDLLDGRKLEQIESQWTGRPGGDKIIEAARIVKTRLENIRTEIRDIKRDAYRSYLMTLDKPTLQDLWRSNVDRTTDIANFTKERLSSDLVQMEFPDDWGIADGSYLPHMFFGSWRITVKELGSEEWQFVDRAKTISEAKVKVYQLVKDDPTLRNADFRIGGDTIVQGDVVRLGDARFWKMVSQMKEQLELSRSEIKQAMAGFIGRRSGRQKFFGNLRERIGYQGFERDFRKVMSAYLSQFHRWRVLSRLNRDVQPLIDQVRKEGREQAAQRLSDIMDTLWGKPAQTTALFDNFIRRIPVVRDHIKPLVLERLSRMVRRAVSGMALTTVRFSMVNRLQPLQGLYPLIGERLMVKAKVLQHTAEGRRLLDEAGVTFDPGQYAPERGVRTRVSEALEKWSGERSNQEVAFLGMYLHGRERGLGHAQAIRYGKLRGQLFTQFTPLVADTPPALQGPIASMLFQFKRFPIKQLELMSDMVRTGNVTGIGRWLGVMTMLGGVGYFLRQAVFPSDESKNRLRRWAQDELGDKGADLLLYGLPGWLGADITGSLTLGDDFYGSSFYEKAGRELAGPAVSMTVDTIRSLMTAPREDLTATQKTIDMMRRVPTLKPLAELIALDAQHGGADPDLDVRTPSGEVRYRKTLKEALVSLGSFRTSSEANQALAVDAIVEIKKHHSQLKNDVYVAMSSGGDVDKAIDRLNRYNTLWPEVAVTPHELTSYLRSRAKAQPKTQQDRIAGRKYAPLLVNP